MVEMKNSGYSKRNKLGNHHEISKSPRKIQKAIACKPEQNVKTKDISARALQIGFSLFHSQILIKPDADIKRSSGRNDQFHADKIGLS